MRTYLASIFLCYLSIDGVAVYAQAPLSSTPSGNQNYIVTNTMLVKDVKEESQIVEKTVEEVSQTVEYFDGLGRPVQTVNTKASPTGKDIVSPQEYDVYGREVRKYLPYSSSVTPGGFKVDALGTAGQYLSSDQYLFYQNTPNVAHDKPLSETILEASPLNRLLKQGAPGSDWQALPEGQSDRSVERSYNSNASNEVLQFGYDLATNNVVFNTLTYYAPNQLYVTRTTDEQEHEVVQYTDKEGRTILKKVEYKEENDVKLYAETYYIYDDFGNLVVVLPPEAVVSIKSSVSSN